MHRNLSMTKEIPAQDHFHEVRVKLRDEVIGKFRRENGGKFEFNTRIITKYCIK